MRGKALYMRISDDTSIRTCSLIRLMTGLVTVLLCNSNVNQVNASKSASRWHLQRIVQRENLSPEQISSGVQKVDLKSIAMEDSIFVYIIDTGILIEHEEFQKSRAIYGVDIQNPGVPPRDCNGHGTHVAALAVGAYSGVATNAKAISVRALDCSGLGHCSDIINALDYVLSDTKMRKLERSVAVLSVGSISPTCSPTMKITQILWNSGVVLTAAAGNNNTDACSLYPARNAGTITVGATDNRDRVYKANNNGDCIDLFAPGVDILSASGGTSETTAYKIRTGTSMAAPIVAGMAALMLGSDRTLTPDDIRTILITSSTRNRILTSSGSQTMTNSFNRLAFAPWSRLFEEVAMNSNTIVIQKKDRDAHTNTTFEHHDKDWNSSASIISLSITFQPRAIPAMHYSVIRISSALAQAAGVRSASILVRRPYGIGLFSNGTEPKLVPLVFYIPMLPEFAAGYKKRLIQAEMDGSISTNSFESYTFPSGSMETAMSDNVTVPPRAYNETYFDPERSIGRERLSPGAIVAVICVGVLIALIAITLVTVMVFVPQLNQYKDRRQAAREARGSAVVTVPPELGATQENI